MKNFENRFIYLFLVVLIIILGGSLVYSNPLNHGHYYSELDLGILNIGENTAYVGGDVFAGEFCIKENCIDSFVLGDSYWADNRWGRITFGEGIVNMGIGLANPTVPVHVRGRTLIEGNYIIHIQGGTFQKGENGNGFYYGSGFNEQSRFFIVPINNNVVERKKGIVFSKITTKDNYPYNKSILTIGYGNEIDPIKDIPPYDRFYYKNRGLFPSLLVNGEIRAEQFCLGNECISNWGSKIGSWENGFDNRYTYNSGNVGINVNRPKSELHIGSYPNRAEHLPIMDLKIPASNRKVGDVLGVFSSSTEWIPNNSPLKIKLTNSKHDGNFGGYRQLHLWIQNNGCEGYHVCSSEEIISWMMDNGRTESLRSKAWFNSGIPSVKMTFPNTLNNAEPDCGGWGNINAASSGHIWYHHAAYTETCLNEHYVLCCK